MTFGVNKYLGPAEGVQNFGGDRVRHPDPEPDWRTLYHSHRYGQIDILLRAKAVATGAAERLLAMAILPVCLSVCHYPVPIQAQVR